MGKVAVSIHVDPAHEGWLPSSPLRRALLEGTDLRI
jgi:hypothetical protein